MTEDTRPHYSEEQETTIVQLEADLAAHMRDVRPKRYEHSLSVAKTAESMAIRYGADPFLARCAGILHDWDKVLSADEQVKRAIELGVDMGVDLELVQPLLHGLTAALTLPTRYPKLPPEIFRAISLHTVGSADMTALDKILFVADGIEPLRKPAPAIHHANGYSPRKGGEKAGDYAGKLALDRFNRPIYQRVKLGIVGRCTPGLLDRRTEDPDDCSPLPQDIVGIYRETMAVRDNDDKVRSKRIPAPIAAQLAVGSRIEAPSDDDLNACEL